VPLETADMAVDSDYLDQITKYIETMRLRASNGLTISELSESVIGGMRVLIAALDRVSSMTGAEKKAEVLKLVAYLFDQFADACVPLVAKPVWWIVKPAVRTLVLSMASGAVESLLPLVRAVA
jgi:hypothetical protein